MRYNARKLLALMMALVMALVSLPAFVLAEEIDLGRRDRHRRRDRH